MAKGGWADGVGGGAGDRAVADDWNGPGWDWNVLQLERAALGSG